LPREVGWRERGFAVSSDLIGGRCTLQHAHRRFGSLLRSERRSFADGGSMSGLRAEAAAESRRMGVKFHKTIC
jgi:hypothetical protein